MMDKEFTVLTECELAKVMVVKVVKGALMWLDLLVQR